MLPFDLLDANEPERLDRVIGVEPKWNAWVELHNLIVSSESIQHCGPEDALRVCRHHGVRLKTDFFAERSKLYSDYLDYCLDKKDLGEENREMLAHLARTLFLSGGDLQPIHERAFGRTVSDVLSDDCVTFEERLLLYTLQHTLGLDPKLADGTYERLAREKLLSAVAHALCDGMLSPNEEKEIRALQEEYGVQIPAHIGDLLKRAKKIWNVFNGPLPHIDAGIVLNPGEIAHFQTSGKWKRLNYARLRILLGAHREWLNRGETAHLRVPNRALSGRWYEGRFIVTNRRLILASDHREPIVYSLSAIGGVERYFNGIRVSIAGDRSLYFNAGRRTSALQTVLSRLLNSEKSPHA